MYQHISQIPIRQATYIINTGSTVHVYVSTQTSYSKNLKY
jgi:hypothetical protein